MYVPAWGTHVIVRKVDQNTLDAIGTYPIASLARNCDLVLGLEQLRQAGVITVILVSDCLFGPGDIALREAFSYVRPFKTHYLIDPTYGHYLPTEHHRYEIRRAENHGVEVRTVRFFDILDEWTELYEQLISRHQITGTQRFSRASFEALARCDGLTTVAAFLGSTIVACHLWFQHDGIVWSHLAATSRDGYKHGAAFALHDYTIRTFSRELINLGGAAGLDDASDGGLALFKAGFSNRKHQSKLYGAVLDSKRYEALCLEGLSPKGDYFPWYRAPSTAT